MPEVLTKKFKRFVDVADLLRRSFERWNRSAPEAARNPAGPANGAGPYFPCRYRR